MGNERHPPCFTVRDLSFSYGKKPVLDGVSFTVPEGKITTLMGANGCGKTTLFQLMTKNLTPKDGAVLLRGEDVAGMPLKSFARRAAIVHQYNTAPPDLTVERLVWYGRTPYHAFGQLPSASDEEAVERALEITGLRKHRGENVSELSGGQKQRVWMAVALAQQTEVLFLDEPTTYLDIRYQLQILRLVRRLNEEYGMTILMVLHDINQALYYSDEVLLLDAHGLVLAQGAPAEQITPELLRETYGIGLEVLTVHGKKLVLTVG